MSKTFSLEAVVALVANRTVVMGQEGPVADLISFMIGKILILDETLTDMEKCRECLLAQFPFLADIDDINEKNYRQVLQELFDELGFTKLSVSSITSWMNEEKVMHIYC